MLRLVSTGGAGTPHPPITRNDMQHVQDTLKHAANDANEALHCHTLGLYSLFNAWAMGTRAMANGIIATVESMSEQSRMAWEQGQQATQHFSRMGQPGQPAQPPRQATGS